MIDPPRLDFQMDGYYSKKEGNHNVVRTESKRREFYLNGRIEMSSILLRKISSLQREEEKKIIIFELVNFTEE